MMIPGKFSVLVICVAAAGMGILVAMWLLDFSLVRTNWCEGAENTCFREWVSATSGWVGAIAALATIFFLYSQIKEQQKQTSYAIGEAEPDFMIELNFDDDALCKLRIINFSRHTIIVDKIIVKYPEDIEVNGFIIDQCHIGGDRPRFKVDGNRGNISNTVTRDLTVKLMHRSLRRIVLMTEYEYAFRIEYRKIAQRHSKHVGEAYALPRDML